MADMKPRIAAVRDGQGRMAIYMDESVGQDAIVSYFGPRYQQIVIRGEPCTILFDKNMRYFIIAPIRNKQEFVDRPGRYDHVIDLPEIPTTGTAGTAGTEATGNPQSTEGVPHPPPTNSWTLFMQEKWQELREANPNISLGEVSTEASRQWKAMSDEKKRNYQETAWELTEQHKFEYGDHSSRPGKK